MLTRMRQSNTDGIQFGIASITNIPQPFDIRQLGPLSAILLMLFWPVQQQHVPARAIVLLERGQSDQRIHHRVSTDQLDQILGLIRLPAEMQLICILSVSPAAARYSHGARFVSERQSSDARVDRGDGTLTAAVSGGSCA